MKIISGTLIFILFLAGCQSSNTAVEVFHEEIKNNEEVDRYKMVEFVEEDNIIMYTSETLEGNEQINIAYFTKSHSEWAWTKTGVCPLDEWSANLEDEPYLWCGTLTQPRHKEIVVGGTTVESIRLQDGIRRAWYHLSENNNEEIRVILTDGSEEWLKEVK
nr:hypothetical protein [Bacillus sp. SG-1]